MPLPPLKSPVTGKAVAADYIHSDATCGHFRDTQGRTLLLRGVNLASSAKLPTNQPSWKLEGFWEGAESGDISFVNRTFNLDDGEADVHLRKLKAWGFTCFRYVFTWEAIEHAGPGKYDEAFIDYTIKMLLKIKDYGFRVFMDPHQDLFSRFAGGDGAPYWVLLAAGMNPRHFTATNAAVIHCEWPSTSNPDPENFPDMIWASSYQRLANLTLQTLFWAGKVYAPLCVIDGINIQDWMQRHYFAAIAHLAERIQAYDNGSLFDSCVIGWDSLNEPNGGLTGVDDVSKHATAQNVLRIGPCPTAFEAMRLGTGERLDVDEWKFSSTGPKKVGKITIDPQGQSVWASEKQELAAADKYGWKKSPSWPVGRCMWAAHGVWDEETRVVLQPAYFRTKPQDQTRKVDFGDEFWLPHFREYARMIRRIHKEAILFAHSPVFEVPPDINSLDELKDRAVFSTHFYDGVTLVTKHWNWFNYDILGVLRGKYYFLWQGARIGEAAIRKMLQQQITYLREDGLQRMGNFPVMLSEIGQPFDLDNRRSYQPGGNYQEQIKALDSILNSCDGINSANYTTWCYSASNTHRYGEDWNGEDLSLFSLDDITGVSRSPSSQSLDNSALLAHQSQTTSLPVDSGARALQAFCRPYPLAVVGIIEKIHFEIATSLFKLEVKVAADDVSDTSLPTEVFLPSVHYAPTDDEDTGNDGDRINVEISVSSGAYNIKGNILYWHYERPERHSTQVLHHRLEVRRAGGPKSSAGIAARSSTLAWLLRPLYVLQESCVVS